MKYSFSPRLRPDRSLAPEHRYTTDLAYVKDAIGVDGAREALRRSAAKALPVSPLELGAQCHWRAEDASATNSGAHSADAGIAVAGANWQQSNIATPTQGVLDPNGGATAWAIRDNATNAAHGLCFSVWNINASTSRPIHYEAILRPAGTRYIHFFDAWDADPTVTLSPSGGVVAVRTGANVLARGEALPHGYYKVTIVAPAGVLRCETTNGLFTALGSSTAIQTYVGDGSCGFDLLSAYGYQYSAVTSWTAIGPLAVALTGDGTNIPYLVPESSAAGQPAIWAAPPQYGTLSSNNATLLGYYASGQPHTTAMLIYPERSHTTGVTFFTCVSSGAGFAFGTTGTTDQYWVGHLNTTGEWSISSESMNLNEPSALVVVYTGTRVTFYVNGVAVIDNWPVTFGTYTPNSVRVYPQNGMAITEVAVFNRAISAGEAASLSEYLLRHFDRPSNQMDVHNGILWGTDPELRLSCAELHLRNDGQAKSIKVRAQGQTHSSTLATYDWGPVVIADGTVVGVMKSENLWSYEKTYQLPSGCEDVIVRDSGSEMFKLCCVDRVTGDGLTVIPEPTPYRRFLVLGDSVACGANATILATQGWAMQLRDNQYYVNASDASRTTALVTLWGTGSWALANSGLTSGQRQVAAARFAELLDGTDDSDVLIMAWGVNDGTGNYPSWGSNAATFWAAYADLLNRIHTAKPNALVLCVAPHNCPSSPYASNITAIRNQIVANAEGLGSWCRMVNLGSFSVEMDGSDSTGLHPTTAGQNTIYTAVYGRLSTLGWLSR